SRRRHTRCLSDWSSDVCSSDLHTHTHTHTHTHAHTQHTQHTQHTRHHSLTLSLSLSHSLTLTLPAGERDESAAHDEFGGPRVQRSGERRVGKECGQRVEQEHEC